MSLIDIGIYLRDGPFASGIGIGNLHPSEGTHWIGEFDEKYFGSYCCSPPQKLSKFIIKRNRYCLYSEYKIQGSTNKRESYCASFCLYVFCLMKVLDIDFKSAVLILYYQMMR